MEKIILKVIVIITFLLISPALIKPQQTLNDKQTYQAYIAALRLAGNGQYDKAIDGFKEIIKKDSSFYKAYIKITFCYKQKNALDEAQQYFEDLIVSHPKNSYAYHGLGLTYKEKKAYQKALEKFLKSIQLNPEYYAVYPDFVDAHRDLDEAAHHLNKMIEEKPDIAAIHYGLAHLYYKKNLLKNTLEESKKAIELKPTFLDARRYIILAYKHLYEYNNSLNECELGLKLSRDIGDIENEILILIEKSFLTNKQLDNPIAATDIFIQALAMAQDIGDKDKMGIILNNMAHNYWTNCEYHKAIECAKQALEVDIELDNKANQAGNLNYIGIFNYHLGDYSKAWEFFEQAGDIFQEIGRKGYAAMCIGNMGGIYLELDMDHKAIPLFNQAIGILNELDPLVGRKFMANYTGCMGTAYKKLKNYEEALRCYNQALQLFRELKTEEHQIIYFLCHVGKIYQEQKDYSKALKYYEQALKISPRIFKETTKAISLFHLGSLFHVMKDYKKAEEFFEKTLKVSRQINETGLIWQAEAGLAYAYQKQMRNFEALNYYKRAVNTIEEVRSHLKLEEEKSSFFKNKTEVYANLISVLAELHQQDPNGGYDEEAFHYAERAKARALLDIIYQGKIFHNLDDISADFRQKFLMNEKKREERHSKLSRELAKVDSIREQELIISLNSEIDSLQRVKAQLMKEMQLKYPRYYRLANPKKLTLKEIQTDILNDGQVLLEYFVSEEKIFILIMTKQHLEFKTINLTRNKLENKLATISPLFIKEKKISEMNIDQVWANFRTDLLHELYEILLEKPAVEFLQSDVELIIIPDDILFYFPFDVLVTGIIDDEAHYLIESHPISYSSSASLLHPELQKESKAKKDLLAYGNPDFGIEQKKSIVEWASSLVPARSILRENQFAPLPSAEVEVEEIAKNFNQPAVYIGKKATEDRFKQIADQFNFIHLATHHLSDDKQPMYSKIIFAQTDDKKEDGFLQTYEVYNLKLNANMAVLSGCNTGLGKLSKGEGLIGMTRAFFYAGVPSLIVSLWNVADASTAQLMAEFYRNLNKGMNKAKALQQAKLQLMKQTVDLGDKQISYAHPFFWAPFVLIGDSEPISTSHFNLLDLWWLSLLLVSLIVLIIIWKRKRKSSI